MQSPPKVYSCKGNNGILHITFKYTDGVEEDIFVTRNTDKSCTAVRHFRNGSENVPRLNELFCKFSGITFGEVPRDDYFYHLENPRMYVRYCIGVDEDPFQLCRDSSAVPESNARQPILTHIPRYKK